MEPDAERFARFLELLYPGAGFENAVAGGRWRAPEWLGEKVGLARLELARRGFQAVAARRDPSPDELQAARLVIHLLGRPALEVRDGRYALARGEWTGLDAPGPRARLEALLPSVGRVELPGHPLLPRAGTAFVVAPELVMTSGQVARLFTRGQGRRGLDLLPGVRIGVDFRCERDQAEGAGGGGGRGSLGPEPSGDWFEVREVAMIHPHWDMALLRVEGLGSDRPPLRLGAVEPTALADGQELALLGHPALAGDQPRDLQDAAWDGAADVKRVLPGRARAGLPGAGQHLAHDAACLGLHAGSALVEVERGLVVGLHVAHGFEQPGLAVPAWELLRDPWVRDLGLHFEGALPPGEPPWMGAWRKADPPLVATSLPAASLLRVGVALGRPRIGGAPLAQTAPALEAAPAPRPVRRLPYDDRAGYDPDFLGAGASVRLPWLSWTQYQDTAMNQQATWNRHVLPYHRFSVVMCRSRRLAWFTAANIDGRQQQAVRRGDDTWFDDPRIHREEQWGDGLYEANDLDQGHLVRREDTCWGTTEEQARLGNDDSFHWTNRSPQHKDINRTGKPWYRLEGHLLRHARNRDLRITVFTGPLFRADDPWITLADGLRSQLPRDFWKVVCMVRDDGALSATGYLVSQRDELRAMPGVEVPWAFGAFETFQRPLRDLEALTGLTFRGLLPFDPLEAGGQEAAPGAARGRRLADLDQIHL